MKMESNRITRRMHDAMKEKEKSRPKKKIDTTNS